MLCPQASSVSPSELTNGTDVESHFAESCHLAELNQELDDDGFRNLIEESAASIHEDLVAAYVNGRVTIERANGNAGKIDHGKLAASAPTAIASKPMQLRHGKTLLRKLRSSFQEKFQKNLSVFRTSANLGCDKLKTIARKIKTSKTSSN